MAALVVAGMLIISGCGQEPSPSRPPATGGPDSFTFFDLGRASVLDDVVRQRLARELGDAAVERRGILDLASDGRRILAEHLPVLDALNRRLNRDYRERVEHDLFKLMYRYPGRTSPAFETVRLVFDLVSGLPLHFEITANQAGAEILAVLKEKYGPPGEISDPTGPLLLWEKHGDRLLVLPRRSRLGQPEYHIRIYFLDNIEAMLAREADTAAQERAQNARSAF
jgi:hypothetical protein